MIKTVEVKMEPNFMKFTKMLMHYITKYFLGFLIVFLSSILVAFVASRSIEDYIIEKGEMKNQEGINGIYELSLIHI